MNFINSSSPSKAVILIRLVLAVITSFPQMVRFTMIEPGLFCWEMPPEEKGLMKYANELGTFLLTLNVVASAPLVETASSSVL